MSKHTEGAGAAQPITGKNKDALDRESGYSKTISALESRTASQHKGTSKHDNWEGPMCGWGDDNVKH
jgi:hypothetical protein